MSVSCGDAIAFYAHHPAEFVEDIIGAKPDRNQTEILNSVTNNTMTTVRSGHGVGKSAVEAWAVIWYMCTRPFPKIPCTAPTQHQLFDILWAEISKWTRNSDALSEELVCTRTKLYMRGYPEEWFAVARTSSKPDALQGFHAEHLLYVIDEASGVDDDIFEPVLGALSTPDARLLMCGNPVRTRGFFYDSHTKNRENYSAYHIDGRNSDLVEDEYIERIIRMYGDDSNVFRVRVAGEFPTAEDDVFIPLPLIEQSVHTDYAPSGKPSLIHIGCDVARYGDDKTVIGYRTDEKIEFYKKRRGQDTMKTADDIIILGQTLAEKYKLNPKEDLPIAVKIDDGGLGGGVTDRLRQIKRGDPERFWWLRIYPILFGQRIKNRYYYDSTTFMAASVKRMLNPFDEQGGRKPVELILPDDESLIAQLSTRKYGLSDTGKIKIESKEAFKRRGMPSPDEADCVFLLGMPVKIKKDRESF